ncbi:MAG: hypothetical protein ABR570_11880 [Burkholderiales bacterium]
MANFIGAIGVALLLAAFLLNLLKVLRAEGFTYGVLNLVGAALACYSSYLIDFVPFVILEGVWTLAAAFALARAAFTPASG